MDAYSILNAIPYMKSDAVLATILSVSGHSYRKTGAMMLFLRTAAGSEALVRAAWRRICKSGWLLCLRVVNAKSFHIICERKRIRFGGNQLAAAVQFVCCWSPLIRNFAHFSVAP